MKEALKQANKAYDKGEVPIGAIVVKDGKIISRAYNKRETEMKATSHAEIIAIEKACKKLNNWRLNDCDLYVTLEPCPMCAGAILNSRIKNLYFGAYDKKSGAIVSNLNMLDYEFCNHRTNYESEIMKIECEKIIKDFFKELRK
ncbi:MAG: tRNA adenosine(34) deaminase TadA [Clostridia bacterium]|nr:tRNA adenosine(34) deaminase TadA [Clostridia bacterium]